MRLLHDSKISCTIERLPFEIKTDIQLGGSTEVLKAHMNDNLQE